ncbi:hypothetical protein [uncultured Nostoc sp.]|uniref:hypothetical protein n=1 Tax=uncultured Nostoc sp. TaxID=340711 RepID=UPI0035CC042B
MVNHFLCQKLIWQSGDHNTSLVISSVRFCIGYDQQGNRYQTPEEVEQQTRQQLELVRQKLECYRQQLG